MTSQNNNIFITGGTGFIGKRIVETLLQCGFNCFILTRKDNYKLSASPNVKYITGDLLDINKYSDVIGNCSYLVHIAGEKKNISEMYRVNVGGMKHLMEQLMKYPFLKFVHISSSGVYGIQEHPDMIISESSCCYPGNEYEKSKYEAEKILQLHAEVSATKYVILRPSNVIGEGDPGNKLLNLMRSLKNGRFIYLDKNAYLNYVYVEYLANVIACIIKNNMFSNSIFNVNSPCKISELIEQLKTNLGLTYKIPNLSTMLIQLFHTTALVFDHLPARYQYYNSAKHFELVNNKYYSIQKIESAVPADSKQILFSGLKNMVGYYRRKGLI
jgi:nucleoside-diphosphate-sugar epimerase